nr:MAG: RNA-dependent RNA polymerase [Tuatara cloaca-associated tombusvirus-10]
MRHEGVVPVLANAKVTLRAPVMRRRLGAYKIPRIGLGPAMGTYTNDLHEAHVGLARRVLMRYDKDTDQYHERVEPSARLVDERLAAMSERFLRATPAPVVCRLEEYHKLYTGSKRVVYKNATDSLRRGGLLPKDARVTGFVKVEATPPGADTRLIQTRSSRYHASLGCFLKLNEKSMYHGVDSWFGEKTIVKGLNGAEVGGLIARKFRAYEDPIAIGLDASRFDRSVSVPLLRWVHRHYKAHIGDNPELAALLEMQINNRGVVRARDGRIDYTVRGGVMSGDIDTSLKGCLIMCAVVGSWARSAGVRVKLVNNGDDCVVFMEGADEARFTDGMVGWMAELGLDIVPEPTVREIEKIEFCQAKPVMDSRGMYVMCRNPAKATVKDSICRTGIGSDKACKRWLASVADCGKALAGDMPIFGAHYRAYGRAAEGVQAGNVYAHAGYASGLYWLSRGMRERAGVTTATRISFWRAWNITPHEQRAIEHYYDTLTIHMGIGPVESVPSKHFHSPDTVSSLANGTQA